MVERETRDRLGKTEQQEGVSVRNGLCETYDGRGWNRGTESLLSSAEHEQGVVGDEDIGVEGLVLAD